jgi:glycosyltransferase involved in cell wall biosynthesis
VSWSGELDAVVVVPTHDGATTIEGALGSAVASIESSGRAVAISVADDASTDDTCAVVERLSAATAVPVVVTRRPVNGGTGAARNTAAAAVDAPVLLFLDQDDEYLQDHVAVCLDALDDRREAHAVATRVVLDRAVHDDWVEAIEGSLTQNLAVRRHAHRLVGGFIDDPATAAVGCDDVLYRRLLGAVGRTVQLDVATVRFRARPGNSFERQFAAKFSRPRAEAADTLSPERARHLPAVEAAFASRWREVSARVRRLR